MRLSVAACGDMEIHPAAAKGFSSAADAYERGRPSYPEQVIAVLLDDVGARGARVLDVGAGTGKLSVLIAPHVASLVGVEPVAEMRAAFARNVPSAGAHAGTAEALPIADASVDVVIAAQAFHWFDGDRALAEFARVLVPGGRVALVWNQADDRVAWIKKAREILEPERKGAPTYRSLAWRHAFERSTAFAPLVTKQIEHVDRRADEASFRDRYASVSFIAAMAPEERIPLLDRLVALRRGHGDGTFDTPYVANIHFTVRLSIPSAGG